MRVSALSRLVALLAALLFAGCSGPLFGSDANRTATAAASVPTPLLNAPPVPVTVPTPIATPAAAYPAAPAYPAAGSQLPASTRAPAASIPIVPPTPTAAVAAPPVLGFRVVQSFPHDPQAFTQGLVYVGNDTFYEGTGLVGRSTLREVALDGTVRRSVAIDPAHFGEGVAVVGQRIFQLTWQNCVGYIYDRASFRQLASFRMPQDPAGSSCLEGWGLTYDGNRLILSDGSSRLFFVDPDATQRNGQLAILGQVNVTDTNGPVLNLNELEYINGQVYANIWQTERIARIDPASGTITAYIDLAGLRDLLQPDPALTPPEVLNGIAYDAANKRLFVTGKLWPRLFQIELVGESAYSVFLPISQRA